MCITNKPQNKMPIMLSIAGSDSSAGAGIQADLKSAAAAGVFCATAITSVTAQNTTGVNGVFNLTAEQVSAQIEAVMSDMNVVSIKTGMLPTKEIVAVVCDVIKKYNVQNVVVDPVMISTSGCTLVDNETISYIIEHLFPLATLVTPNIPEVEFITSTKISSLADFSNTAKVLQSLKAKNVLLKAGHLESDYLTDILYDFEQQKEHEFAYKKVHTKNTHGTGCSLSSYIAAYLTKGEKLADAVDCAERLLHKAIDDSKDICWGDGFGPLCHIVK
ncbi:MAG: bifunctional hydroxymethylpyrimidine kinase/phosphomethylpyrimidine kinase [Rikenellaceae bacterium]